MAPACASGSTTTEPWFPARGTVVEPAAPTTEQGQEQPESHHTVYSTTGLDRTVVKKEQELLFFSEQQHAAVAPHPICQQPFLRRKHTILPISVVAQNFSYAVRPKTRLPCVPPKKNRKKANAFARPCTTTTPAAATPPTSEEKVAHAFAGAPLSEKQSCSSFDETAAHPLEHHHTVIPVNISRKQVALEQDREVAETKKETQQDKRQSQEELQQSPTQDQKQQHHCWGKRLFGCSQFTAAFFGRDAAAVSEGETAEEAVAATKKATATAVTTTRQCEEAHLLSKISAAAAVRSHASSQEGSLSKRQSDSNNNNSLGTALPAVAKKTEEVGVDAPILSHVFSHHGGSNSGIVDVQTHSPVLKKQQNQQWHMSAFCVGEEEGEDGGDSGFFKNQNIRSIHGVEEARLRRKGSQIGLVGEVSVFTEENNVCREASMTSQKNLSHRTAITGKCDTFLDDVEDVPSSAGKVFSSERLLSRTAAENSPQAKRSWQDAGKKNGGPPDFVNAPLAQDSSRLQQKQELKVCLPRASCNTTTFGTSLPQKEDVALETSAYQDNSFNDEKYRSPDEGGREKVILQDITLYARAGEMLVIMGPSGSGKTTLLNALAGRSSPSHRVVHKGYLGYLGLPPHEPLSNYVTYVMQKDKIPEFLTVVEYLSFYAQLKMKNTTSQERAERVEVVMQELGLTKCRNTRVGGSSQKGLSGGEIKRLAVAAELLHNPSVIFLDEPTSGLDSALAFETMKLLLRLAKEGSRAIICTIHQPRSQLFAMFDRLVLLFEGRIVFQGPAKRCVSYFAQRGFPCPAQFNPADFILDLLAVAPQKQQEPAQTGCPLSSQSLEAQTELDTELQKIESAAAAEGASSTTQHPPDSPLVPALKTGTTTTQENTNYPTHPPLLPNHLIFDVHCPTVSSTARNNNNTIFAVPPASLLIKDDGYCYNNTEAPAAAAPTTAVAAPAAVHSPSSSKGAHSQPCTTQSFTTKLSPVSSGDRSSSSWALQQQTHQAATAEPNKATFSAKKSTEGLQLSPHQQSSSGLFPQQPTFHPRLIRSPEAKPTTTALTAAATMGTAADWEAGGGRRSSGPQGESSAALFAPATAAQAVDTGGERASDLQSAAVFSSTEAKRQGRGGGGGRKGGRGGEGGRGGRGWLLKGGGSLCEGDQGKEAEALALLSVSGGLESGGRGESRADTRRRRSCSVVGVVRRQHTRFKRSSGSIPPPHQRRKMKNNTQQENDESNNCWIDSSRSECGRDLSSSSGNFPSRPQQLQQEPSSAVATTTRGCAVVRNVFYSQPKTNAAVTSSSAPSCTTSSSLAGGAAVDNNCDHLGVFAPSLAAPAANASLLRAPLPLQHHYNNSTGALVDSITGARGGAASGVVHNGGGIDGCGGGVLYGDVSGGSNGGAAGRTAEGGVGLGVVGSKDVEGGSSCFSVDTNMVVVNGARSGRNPTTAAVAAPCTTVTAEEGADEQEAATAAYSEDIDAEVHRVSVKEDTVRKLADFYMASEERATTQREIQRLFLKASCYSAPERLGLRRKTSVSAAFRRLLKKATWDDYCRETRILLQIHSLNLFRNSIASLVQLCLNMLLGLIVGSLFFDLPGKGYRTESARNIFGVLFFFASQFSFGPLDSLSLFCEDREVFNRDTANGNYRCLSFFIAKTIANIPFQHIPLTCFMILAYWMCGLYRSFARFLIFVCIGQLCILASSAFLSCISCGSPRVAITQAVAPILLIIIQLVAGYYVRVVDMPGWISWLRYISFLHYTYSALSLNQFHESESWGAQSNATLLSTVGGISNTSMAFNVGFLILIGCFYRVLAYLLLKYTNRRIGLEA